MANVECVRPFGGLKPGDVVEIPDGAEVSPYYFQPVDDEKSDDKTPKGEEDGSN